MKVLLINPPRLNEVRADNPCFIDEERGFNPPLGLLYLAAYIEQNTDFPVQVIDAQAEGLKYDDSFKDRIPKDDDLIIGLTAMTFTMTDVLRTVNLLREVEETSSIKMKIVLGGPHSSIYPEETAQINGVDYVVVGEGEMPFLKLCNSISQQKEPIGIKGVYFKKDGRVVGNKQTELLEDIDQLPFPARHLTDINRYYSILSSGKKTVTTMFTSRGCPFNCSFCSRPFQGKVFRARSAKNVVDEMQRCLEMGVEEILLYDDTFTVDKKRVLDICNEILRRRLEFQWDIRTRVDVVDEDMLKKLKEAGCIRIHFGVEAGTEKVLRALNKGITVEQATKVFEICHRLKIETLAYFMIGNPTETREDIEESIRLAMKLKPEYVHATIFYPGPATPLYERALAEKRFKSDYWLEFAKDPSKGVVTEYWYENFSRDELFELLEHFYHRFYGRPSYIVKSFLKIRSLDELAKKSKAGLKVLGLVK